MLGLTLGLDIAGDLDLAERSRDPDAALMEFLVSTYEAAANLAKWDRQALECPMGECGKVRAL